mmetsp:Transcript_4050/g.13185  ORF Transcript_4050/g.13185 Transcript_4050/m.13185 type:complete len:386 (+) Transcript_4050:1371-2528(+)
MERVLAAHYLPVEPGTVGTFEGRVTRQDEEGDDAGGPHVTLNTVPLVLQHLGGDVVGRSTRRLQKRLPRRHDVRQPKVGQDDAMRCNIAALHGPTGAHQQQVFRLDVTMSHVVRRKVRDAHEQLTHDQHRVVLGELAACHNLVKQFATVSKLNNEVDVAVRLERSLEREDVAVLERLHDAQLAHQPVVVNLCLDESLQRVVLVCLEVKRVVHDGTATPAQLSAHPVKVLDGTNADCRVNGGTARTLHRWILLGSSTPPGLLTATLGRALGPLLVLPTTCLCLGRLSFLGTTPLLLVLVLVLVPSLLPVLILPGLGGRGRLTGGRDVPARRGCSVRRDQGSGPVAALRACRPGRSPRRQLAQCLVSLDFKQRLAVRECLGLLWVCG